MTDWRNDIVVGVLVQQRIEELDREHLWERHLPEVAATESQLADTERRLGFALDPIYREFLGYANGWRHFWQSVDLFGLPELLGKSPMDVARQQLGAVSGEDFRRTTRFDKGETFPIGASTDQPDMFLICQPWSGSPGSVLWYTGQLIDAFSNFREFYLAMLDYNREEVRDLEVEAG